MHFWTNYVVSKPEVDDSDLPLPEHRLFDDDGGVRTALTSRQLNSFLSTLFRQCKASARKAPGLSPKRRLDLLRAVRARWTRRAAPADKAPPAEASSTSEDESPAKSPARRPSTTAAKSPAKSSRSRSRSASAKKSTPIAARPKSPSPAKRSPNVSPRKAPATRSPSPAKAATPARKAAKKSTSRARSGGKSSKKRSRSRSSSRATSSAKPQPSSTPNSKWTVAALKEYAKDNAVTVAGLHNKAEILAAINKAS